MGVCVYFKNYKGQSLCSYELCVAYIGYVKLYALSIVMLTIITNELKMALDEYQNSYGWK
jgi:hypothetical protein